MRQGALTWVIAVFTNVTRSSPFPTSIGTTWPSRGSSDMEVEQAMLQMQDVSRTASSGKDMSVDSGITEAMLLYKTPELEGCTRHVLPVPSLTSPAFTNCECWVFQQQKMTPPHSPLKVNWRCP